MTDDLPLAKPDIGPEEERLVLEVLRSGMLSLGPMGRRFEEEFAAWLGVDDAVSASSGTAALHLGVRALGWSAGDEVVLTPFTFVASANCLLMEGVKPVFADIDPVTLNLDPTAAEAAIGPRTAGLLPVDIFGYPSEMNRFEEIAAARGLGLLEDSAQALGAIDPQGRKVGSRGNLAVFAFYANKQMTTGEGGMLIPRSADEASQIRSERNQGRSTDMSWLEHDRLGFNYRLSDIAAAVGVAQVERLDSILAARAASADTYARHLAQIEGLELPQPGSGECHRSWFVYPVRLPESTDRDAVIGKLAEQGIPAKAYLPAIHLLPHLRDLGYSPGMFPVTEAVAERSLALPFYAGLSDSDADRVASALKTAITG